MKEFCYLCCKTILIALALCAPLSSLFGEVDASAGKIDPEADQVLKQMSDYFGRLDSFAVSIVISRESESASRTEEERSAFALAMRRPNKLSFSQKGGRITGEMVVSDGTNVYTYNPAANEYTTKHAPAKLDDLLLALPFSVMSKGAWLFMESLAAINPYEAMMEHVLMEDIEDVTYVGVGEIGKVKCHRIKFSGRAPLEKLELALDYEWEVWVEADSTPVLRKIVEGTPRISPSSVLEPPARVPDKVATKLEGREGITVVSLEQWKFNAEVPEETFTFTPPPDAKLDEQEILRNSSKAKVFIQAAALIVQPAFRDDALVDQDGDGVGEYGFLQELLGTAGLRGRRGVKKPEYILLPDVPLELVDGVFQGSGYCFKLYLPGDGGGVLSEEKGKPLPLAKSQGIDMQEKHFVVYAWPKKVGETGVRAYAVCEDGEVWQTACEQEVRR